MSDTGIALVMGTNLGNTIESWVARDNHADAVDIPNIVFEHSDRG